MSMEMREIPDTVPVKAALEAQGQVSVQTVQITT